MKAPEGRRCAETASPERPFGRSVPGPYDGWVPVTLCVLVWSVPGNEHLMTAYEDEALGLIANHNGHVLQRVSSPIGGDPPDEVQIVQFPDEAAYASFIDDPRRASAARLRDRCVARTDVFRVDVVSATGS